MEDSTILKCVLPTTWSGVFALYTNIHMQIEKVRITPKNELDTSLLTLYFSLSKLDLIKFFGCYLCYWKSFYVSTKLASNPVFVSSQLDSYQVLTMAILNNNVGQEVLEEHKLVHGITCLFSTEIGTANFQLYFGEKMDNRSDSLWKVHLSTVTASISSLTTWSTDYVALPHSIPAP